VTIPDPQFFNLLKEEGIRKMVGAHYDLLVKSSIKGIFPKDKEKLDLAKQHSADFFIQICGGPKRYNENRGKPMLVSRHAPFVITPSARLVWLECYGEVLIQLGLPEEVLMSFWNYINVFSSWMVNT
jgi:hemoglobin